MPFGFVSRTGCLHGFTKKLVISFNGTTTRLPVTIQWAWGCGGKKEKIRALEE
jgi:hypothetical protein